MNQEKPFTENTQKTNNNLVDYVPAVMLLLVLVIILGFVFAAPNQITQLISPDNDSNDIEAQESGNLNAQIPVSRSKIEYRDKTISIPEGWYVDIVLLSDDNSVYECVSGNCTIYVIRSEDEDALINKFALSTPSKIGLVDTETDDLTGITTPPVYEFTLFGEKLSFEYTSYYSVNAVDGVVDFSQAIPKYPAELYACATNQMCLHVGPLSNEESVNDQQRAEIQRILGLLTIK